MQIVHVTTGRVRLRTSDSSLNSILDNIAQDLRSIEGVREVAVNEQTGSLVVNFDEDKLLFDQEHPFFAISYALILSRAKFSFNTLTPGSPKMPRKRPSVF